MKYRVWVSLPNGQDHIPLLESTDQQKAQQLLDVLVSSSTGVSLDIGASITDDGTQPQAAGRDQDEPRAEQPAATRQQPEQQPEPPPTTGRHPRQQRQ